MNLEDMKCGDIAHFKNGESAKVKNVASHNFNMCWYVTFEGFKYEGFDYCVNGEQASVGFVEDELLGDDEHRKILRRVHLPIPDDLDCFTIIGVN